MVVEVCANDPNSPSKQPETRTGQRFSRKDAVRPSLFFSYSTNDARQHHQLRTSSLSGLSSPLGLFAIDSLCPPIYLQPIQHSSSQPTTQHSKQHPNTRASPVRLALPSPLLSSLSCRFRSFSSSFFIDARVTLTTLPTFIHGSKDNPNMSSISAIRMNNAASSASTMAGWRRAFGAAFNAPYGSASSWARYLNFPAQLSAVLPFFINFSANGHWLTLRAIRSTG